MGVMECLDWMITWIVVEFPVIPVLHSSHNEVSKDCEFRRLVFSPFFPAKIPHFSTRICVFFMVLMVF